MSDREPFFFSKQAGAFADVTRWLKDSFGTLRGAIALGLIFCAIFGSCYLGVRIINFFLPKKDLPQVGQVTNSGGGKVEVVKIDKQKNGFLPWF